MCRVVRLVALAMFAVTMSVAVCAHQTPGPPDWQDTVRSVYLPQAEKSPRTDDVGASLAECAACSAPAVQAAPTAVQRSHDAAAISKPKKFDSKVVPSAYVESTSSDESSSRRLAPPSRSASSADGSSRGGLDNKGPRRFLEMGIPTRSIYTIVTALTVVIGAFLIFAWLLRRGTRAPGRRGTVPAEAVSVLGRVPLTGRQIAELLRVGNKLVLVALTQGGYETITEVTDPAEVDRLVGLCQQQDRHSTSRAFEQVFQNFSHEAAGGGFLGAEGLPTSMSPIAAAYRSHRGGSARG